MVLDILHMPMLMDILFPLIGVVLLVAALMWASKVRRRDPVAHHEHKHPDRA